MFGVESEDDEPPPPPPPPPPKPDNSSDQFNIRADDLFDDDESLSEKKVAVDLTNENSKKLTSQRGNLFDTTTEYDIHPTSKTPVRSEKSFAETIAEFGLLEKNNTSTQKAAVPQSNNSKKPQTLLISQLASSKVPRLLSPDKSVGVMVKVQPTKGVKKNVDNNEPVENRYSTNGWSYYS